MKKQLERIESLIYILLLSMFMFLIHNSGWAKVITPTRTIKVAVIDTGFDFKYPRHVKLCDSGHRDFTGKGQGKPYDVNGHGTHIAGLIARYAGDVDYCLVILKYYTDRQIGSVNLKHSIEAMQYALDLKVDVINYSGGGPEASVEESLVVEALLKAGVKIVAAAGNERQNIDITENAYYPNAYDIRIDTVGAVDINGRKLQSSNFGSKVIWERGENVKSILPGNREGYMSGTSQATAVHTGKVVKLMSEGR